MVSYRLCGHFNGCTGKYCKRYCRINWIVQPLSFSKAEDYYHPYGPGKVEFISAAIEGTLIGVAGFVIIYEAVKNLLHLIKLSNWIMVLLWYLPQL